MVKAAWRQEVQRQSVVCLDDSWGESEAEEATHRVASVYPSARRAGSKFGVAADFTGWVACEIRMSNQLVKP
ncbi:hypothetical protein E2C01_003586 [Portunus trituberculatus]|uniref:Uncharacterized protein n=1 Tax=Portunus trituberculatus TaxID=210409 RepID=A0A5B7CTZ6_PORTR|nr:hypothetical protein [Portunus trituberculatus]